MKMDKSCHILKLWLGEEGRYEPDNVIGFKRFLEGANIKLSSVVSDIMGVSSKDRLRALAEGEDARLP
jgi:hypothetical protein